VYLEGRFPVLALFWSVSTSFLLIVYYGTSFELTPFRLLLAPLRLLHLSPQLYARLDVGSASIEVLEKRSRKAELSGAQESSTADQIGHARYSVFPIETTRESVDEVLQSSAGSAAKLADKMERRINTHLILGVLVGLVGLLIWYYSFFIKGASFDKTHIWSEMVPRVSILLFIELLAGFFLQQYRIGVEDLKYFLELQRRATANRIAYAIFDKLNDNDAKRQFAKSLMETKSDTRLQTGETTTTLEAIKGSDNVVLKALGILGDQLESVTKLVAKDKKG
jgi:hypothetical protein